MSRVVAKEAEEAEGGGGEMCPVGFAATTVARVWLPKDTGLVFNVQTALQRTCGQTRKALQDNPDYRHRKPFRCIGSPHTKDTSSLPPNEFVYGHCDLAAWHLGVCGGCGGGVGYVRGGGGREEGGGKKEEVESKKFFVFTPGCMSGAHHVRTSKAR